MKKLFTRTHIAEIIMVVLALTLLLPSTLQAHRFSNAHFFGQVTLDGISVPEGSVVTARIGQLSWTSKDALGQPGVIFHAMDSWYTVDIPKDTGQGVKNGGVDGDLVYFTVTVNGNNFDDPIPGIWKTTSDIPHSIYLFSVPPPVNNLLVETNSLPDGVVGTPYPDRQLTASGGSPPYTWIASMLPPGIEVSADGIVVRHSDLAGSFGLDLRGLGDLEGLGLCSSP